MSDRLLWQIAALAVPGVPVVLMLGAAIVRPLRRDWRQGRRLDADLRAMPPWVLPGGHEYHELRARKRDRGKGS